MVAKTGIGAIAGFILVVLLMSSIYEIFTGIPSIGWAAGGIIGALAGAAISQTF